MRHEAVQVRVWVASAGRRTRSLLGFGRTAAGIIAAVMVPALAWAADEPRTEPAETQAWALHGQTTFVLQGNAGFRSPYQGPNSLRPAAQARESFDMTLYAGVRPWSGGEIWVNGEVDQGFGLSDTHGLAGFPSGEGSKVGKSAPYPKLPRLFLRQTFDLGGERETVAPDLNQLGGSRTADRVVLTVGKFAVTDVFDTNAYAHDPRHDFLNWAVMDAGTFDYAANAWGYTYGVAAELYRGSWAARAGFFDLSRTPNDTKLDRGFKQFQVVAELERRHDIAGQPGKVRLTAFASSGRMGTFADALSAAEASGGAPDVATVRRYHLRTGVSLNLEQAIRPDLGVFLRAGFGDGRLEPYEFADIDRTVSAGLSLNGTSWGRPDDVVGFAGVINMITKIHQQYLAAGGLGILVGDGRLPHPGLEKILETYYDLAIVGPVRLTFDYQLAVNPAYNRDRGPVSIGAIRLHAQF